MKTYQAFFSTDPRTKKHKVYDEGVILLDGVSITLLDDGKAQLARQPNKCTNLSEGQTLNIGKYTVDVGKECPTSGPVAVRASTPAVASAPRPAATTSMHQQPLRPPSALLHSTAISHSVSGEIPTPFQQEPAAPVPRRAPLASLPVGRGGFKAPRQQLVPRCDDVSSSIEQFKPDPPSSAAQLSLLLPPPPQLAPVVASLGLGAGRGAGVARRPAAVARHDPLVSGALVLQETSLATDASALGAAAGIAVVVDPLLAAPMRPHQREAVRFMWECVQGLRGEAGRRGCILADDSESSCEPALLCRVSPPDSPPASPRVQWEWGKGKAFERPPALCTPYPACTLLCAQKDPLDDRSDVDAAKAVEHGLAGHLSCRHCVPFLPRGQLAG